ncbi:ornithine decarboxylase-like [Biomphalaria glabrata]|uniref:ornithine decarboxylase n=2 Tax=Biomphalaria TaxID=6525 RepID=A0A9W3AES2_BIOGL|nr:ornithine decarboxylase-like [Biomphalaria glabrata]
MSSLPVNVEIYKKIPPMDDIVLDKCSLLQTMGRDDAFFLVSLGDIYQRLSQWRNLLPRVFPFYALKCNNDPEVTKFLADTGIGFDCASKAELVQILDLGVHPSRIVYANPCKPCSHLQFAANNDVDLMTFDDIHELIKVKQYFPKARLLLRIQSNKLHKAKHNFNKKFGCALRSAKRLLVQAKHMHLSVVGVSFHVGSLPEDVTSFSTTICDASLAFKLGEDLGFDMTILDIGGGFPGVDTEHMSFEKVAAVVNTALDTYFPESRGVHIIAEPGRYLATPAFTLAVSVIAKRVVQENFEECSGCHACLDVCECHGAFESVGDDVVRKEEPIRDEAMVRMYYVNDGIYGSFNNVFTDHAIVHPCVLKSSKASSQPGGPSKLHRSILWGPTCDGLDCVMRECLLPDLEVGQSLYFRDMGAYTVTLSCDFNGIPRPLRFYICDDTTWSAIYPNPNQDSYFKCVKADLRKDCLHQLDCLESIPATWSHTTSVPIMNSTENCGKPCCFKGPSYNQNYQTPVVTLEYQQHYLSEYYQPYSPGTPEAKSIPRPSDKRSYRLLLSKGE